MTKRNWLYKIAEDQKSIEDKEREVKDALNTKYIITKEQATKIAEILKLASTPREITATNGDDFMEHIVENFTGGTLWYLTVDQFQQIDSVLSGSFKDAIKETLKNIHDGWDPGWSTPIGYGSDANPTLLKHLFDLKLLDRDILINIIKGNITSSGDLTNAQKEEDYNQYIAVGLITEEDKKMLTALHQEDW